MKKKIDDINDSELATFREKRNQCKEKLNEDRYNWIYGHLIGITVEDRYYAAIADDSIDGIVPPGFRDKKDRVLVYFPDSEMLFKSKDDVYPKSHYLSNKIYKP